MICEKCGQHLITHSPAGACPTCATCGKSPDPGKDARTASNDTQIPLAHFRHCPDCHQLLTLEEEEALRRRALTRS